MTSTKITPLDDDCPCNEWAKKCCFVATIKKAIRLGQYRPGMQFANRRGDIYYVDFTCPLPCQKIGWKKLT